MTSADAIVIGGGLVGAAIAFGLQRRGVRALMLDEGDVAFRAARGNFGLVWVQSKGVEMPPYAQWTWQSAQGWEQLASELTDLTGLRLDYRRPGGIEIFLSDDEMTEKAERMELLCRHAPHVDYRILERRALGNMVPGLGPDVVGGCYSSTDGHVNPLALLRALHAGFQVLGGTIRSGEKVLEIQQQSHGFQVRTASQSFDCEQVVVACGLGTPALAQQVGLQVPVRPQRGQNLITERMRPFLDLPLSGIRQTAEGSVQLGESKEEVGFDDGTTAACQARIASRAVQTFPHLRHARIVRAWGALRVMSPDGAPIYARSETCPGAYAATCHSGVTLAAAHIQSLAAAIAKGGLPSETSGLGPERFEHVPSV